MSNEVQLKSKYLIKQFKISSFNVSISIHRESHNSKQKIVSYKENVNLIYRFGNLQVSSNRFSKESSG